MIVVSDTTILSNLLQTGDLLLLYELYQEVIIPSSVYKELMALETLGISPAKIEQADWILTKEVKSREKVEQLLEELDLGEAEAIILALELKADFFLIDEKIGRQKTRQNGVPIIGTLGILLEAKRLGIINSVKTKMDNLKRIGFWISDHLYEEVLKAAGE